MPYSSSMQRLLIFFISIIKIHSFSYIIFITKIAVNIVFAWFSTFIFILNITVQMFYYVTFHIEWYCCDIINFLFINDILAVFLFCIFTNVSFSSTFFGLLISVLYYLISYFYVNTCQFTFALCLAILNSILLSSSFIGSL